MFVLESWNPDGLQKSYNLTDLDLHGPGVCAFINYVTPI